MSDGSAPPSDRPPPRTGASPLGAAPRTSFVGREVELREISARFRRGDRLVTVLGGPGAGKTRLACHFVRAWKGDSACCSAATARDAAGLVGSLAAALGVPLGGDTLDTDVDHLGLAIAQRGRCLVLIDNLEQLADGAEATIGRWLDLAPAALWLATSRRRLALAGESCLELGGLAPADARELFLERARLVTRDGARGAASLDVLLERLDRLPLAIELAAARAGVLTPEQMIGALAARFELLRAQGTGGMRAAIDTSWELLSEAQRSVFERCAVFSGPFTLAAAAAVLGVAPTEALGALESLRDRSLVQATVGEGDDEARFSLYENLREYAAERLEASGSRRDAEGAHARHHAARGAALAAATDGRAPAAAVRDLAHDRVELLAAHRRACADAPAVAAEAALAVATLLRLRGPFETERALLASAVEIAEALADPTLLARALIARGRSLGMRGLHAAARRDFVAARDAGRAAGAPSLEARGLYGESFTLVESGEDPARAELLAAEGRALARAAGDPYVEAACVASLAHAATSTDLDHAAQLHAEAIALFRRSGSVRALSVAHANLALAREAQGLVDEARAESLEALELAREAGDDVLRGKILWSLTRLSFDAGRVANAEVELQEVEALARATGDLETAAQAPLERARRAILGGDSASAAGWLVKARSAATLVDSPRIVREIEIVGALGARAPGLRVDRRGYWFERPGVGRVDLERRRSLRLVLARLIEARLASEPALGVEALLAAGWPGEAVHPDAGATRVWAAIRMLRRAGLSGVLVSRDGGYALSPSIPLDLG